MPKLSSKLIVVAVLLTPLPAFVQGGGGSGALAGPEGTPLTRAVPAPAEPALGEPTALPLPAVESATR
jgi:hypothetical protein